MVQPNRADSRAELIVKTPKDLCADGYSQRRYYKNYRQHRRRQPEKVPETVKRFKMRNTPALSLGIFMSRTLRHTRTLILLRNFVKYYRFGNGMNRGNTD